MSQPVSVFVVFCCLHISLVSMTVSALPHAPRHIPPVNPDDPARLPKGITKRVLVAGGGLAGLSAALELAERGYKVTIRESSDRIGGKLFSRPVLKLNRTFSVEHGFHAWFNNYHNFKDIRQRLDIDSNFKPWGAVDYIFKNYKPERLYSKGPYPLNLLGIIYRSPNMNLTDPLKSLQGIPDMLWFDYNTVYDKYDEMTFSQSSRSHHEKLPSSRY
ncbi:carotenoid phi-ring synthase-like isoform X2 [Ptychodera flava]|uniref:carotenoid phi-ring synthase-like isoform X2 n=1 Tax=Ptychodera flava TaxID=63121 RepID=UPI00396A7966